MKIKICGQTSVSGCDLSVKYGADYLGVVVNVPWSARSLTPAAAAPIFEKHRRRTFLLTYNAGADDEYYDIVKTLQPCALQLTGTEPWNVTRAIKHALGLPIFKSIHLPPAGEGEGDAGRIIGTMEEYARAGMVNGFILDTAAAGMFGGTGKRNDWEMAAKIIAESPQPVYLAGGINPDNVAEALKVPGIFGIDLASGVEEGKGIKSEAKLRALFEVIDMEVGGGR
ncbi:MAG: phosphoribosylanthranilate isomerase [Nitrospinae bacterium]|nr:phosphoribosylanthranilate isomerase [Nitrospinota bacterium]